MRAKITAEVVADSTNSNTGTRLVTMLLTYHRYIHAEFMTHRVFSRNASSSRAIPISKQIEKVECYPVFPTEWGTNLPGMQAGQALDVAEITEAEAIWALALQDAIKHAKRLKELGVHKQIVNRILEPFSSITVIVTATDWDNFFDLRISPLAQPEIRELAEKMKIAMDMSESVIRFPNMPADAHLPFVTSEERMSLSTGDAMMVSAARCARVSYLNHDGLAPDVSKDLSLAYRLAQDRHASVFEHQAVATVQRCQVRNFKDWMQHRAQLGL